MRRPRVEVPQTVVAYVVFAAVIVGALLGALLDELRWLMRRWEARH